LIPVRKATIFLKKRIYVSAFIMAASVVALYVRKTPMGSSMIVEASIPSGTLIINSLANFSPERDMT